MSTRLTMAGLMAAALSVAACADPDSAVGFDEPSPAARFRAIHAAAEGRDRGAIPDLIRLLNSDDPAERMLAIGTLERMTGQTLGYDDAAPRSERSAAVEKWRAWYAEQGRMDSQSPNAAGSPRRSDEKGT